MGALREARKQMHRNRFCIFTLLGFKTRWEHEGYVCCRQSLISFTVDVSLCKRSSVIAEYCGMLSTSLSICSVWWIKAATSYVRYCFTMSATSTPMSVRLRSVASAFVIIVLTWAFFSSNVRSSLSTASFADDILKTGCVHEQCSQLSSALNYVLIQPASPPQI